MTYKLWGSMQTIPDIPALATSDAANENARCRGWPIVYDPTCQFAPGGQNDLLLAWRKLAEAEIPKRQEMSARLLKPLLRSIAIYERIGDGGARRYRVRLQGSAVVEVIGEITGRTLDEALPEKFLPRWYPMFDVPLATEAPLRILARVDTVQKDFIYGENLCLPLRADDDGEIRLVLISTRYDGTRPWAEAATEECRRLGIAPPQAG